MKKYRYILERERADIKRLAAAGFSYYRIGQLTNRSHVVIRRVVLDISQAKVATQDLEPLGGQRGGHHHDHPTS